MNRFWLPTLLIALVSLGAFGCTDRSFTQSEIVVPTPPAAAGNTAGTPPAGGQGGANVGAPGLPPDFPDQIGASEFPDTPKQPPTGGAAACSAVNATPETCDGIDNDCDGVIDNVPVTSSELQDVANCGTCGNACPPDLATAGYSCVAGTCTLTCFAGQVDLDGAPGCECSINNNGVELCDGQDNDCDGQVDEDFVLNTNENCGACNTPCNLPFATSSCATGTCALLACEDGWQDRDGVAANGCEFPCAVTNGGIEVCDGLDNDCDGSIDEGSVPGAFTCLNRGVCAGTAPTCAGTQGWTCNYPAATYEPDEAKAKTATGWTTTAMAAPTKFTVSASRVWLETAPAGPKARGSVTAQG